jgi:hypothetical protein
MHSKHATGVDKGSKKIRVKGINSARSRGPKQNNRKRGNLGEARGTIRKEKMKQDGKRSGDVRDQLEPARKLMIVATSPPCGTHATDDTKARQQEVTPLGCIISWVNVSMHVALAAVAIKSPNKKIIKLSTALRVPPTCNFLIRNTHFGPDLVIFM